MKLHHCNSSPQRPQSYAETGKIFFLSVLSELGGKFFKFLYRSDWTLAASGGARMKRYEIRYHF
jgi:hypothetical protein